MRWLNVWLNVVTVAMLIWGNFAFASVPSTNESSSQDRQVISSWMAHLNYYHGELQVSSKANVNDPKVRDQVFEDLRKLENATYGDRSIPAGSLKTLECTNVVCGDGPPGHCSICTPNGE